MWQCYFKNLSGYLISFLVGLCFALYPSFAFPFKITIFCGGIFLLQITSTLGTWGETVGLQSILKANMWKVLVSYTILQKGQTGGEYDCESFKNLN